MIKKLLLIFLLILTYTNNSFAHGGDEHSHEYEAKQSDHNHEKAIKIEKTIKTEDAIFDFTINQSTPIIKENKEIKFEVSIVEVFENKEEHEHANIKKLSAKIFQNNFEVDDLKLVHCHKDEGICEYNYTFRNGGEYKLNLALETNDNKKATINIPITVIANPINYTALIVDFSVLFFILILIISFYKTIKNSPNASKALNETFILTLFSSIFFSASVYVIHSFITVKEPEILYSEEREDTNLINISKESQLLFGITTLEIEEKKLIKGLSVTGNIVGIPQLQAEVLTPLAGTLTLEKLTLGDYVKKGQLLATTNERLSKSESINTESSINDLKLKKIDFEETLTLLKTKLKNANLELIRAKQDQLLKDKQLESKVFQVKEKVSLLEKELARVKKNYEVGGANLKEVQEAENNLKQQTLELNVMLKERDYVVGAETLKRVRMAELDKELAEKEIQTVQEKLLAVYKASNEIESGKSKTNTILAPIDGYISSIRTFSGDNVEKGKSIISIINNEKVWLEANVFEKDLEQIVNSKKASFTVTSLPNKVFEIDGKKNKLINIGTVVDKLTRTIPLTYEITNEDSKLRSGMFANITIDNSKASTSIVIPENSLSEEVDGNFVYVFNGAETFEKRRVKVGDVGQKEVEIIKGLEKEERIAFEGIYQLKSSFLTKK